MVGARLRHHHGHHLALLRFCSGEGLVADRIRGRVPVSIIRVVGEVKLLASYKCVDCGCVTAGETMRMTIDAITVEDAAEQIKSHDTRRGFPVGWAGFQTGLKCGKCLERIRLYQMQ